jgi:hypothetical protein
MPAKGVLIIFLSKLMLEICPLLQDMLIKYDAMQTNNHAAHLIIK